MLIRLVYLCATVLAALCLAVSVCAAQVDTLRVRVLDEGGRGLAFATVGDVATGLGGSTDLDGRLALALPARMSWPLALRISSVGYETRDTALASPRPLELSLKPAAYALDDVVVTGTLAPTLRTESPVPVEVYTRTFLLSDPTPSLFEAMQNVNGVRPQLNCGICNTGDIHINGLEGPYTMVTVDGMPIVSGLGTVYGLTGIPTALIERVEVVKGPAGSLYGAEAIGGLINVITRDVRRAPRLSVDAFATGLGDATADVGFGVSLGAHARMLTGVNLYNFDRVVDRNGDGYTDQALARRASVFQKWAFTGGAFEGLTLAARGLAESRHGGQVGYRPERHRAGEVQYGESIDTRRAELLLRYRTRLPGLTASASANWHRQESDYGTTAFDATQAIGFGQVTYARTRGRHHSLFGAATRYTYYDDETVATETLAGRNAPQRTLLPGAFAQHEYVAGRHRLLAGLRYDHHPEHGGIWTPRVAYKLPVGEGANLRLNVGTGFRVVNLFTEDHAALTGGRTVVVERGLNPERSVSANLNFAKRWQRGGDGPVVTAEASTWYTRFSNQIIPDYTSDPLEIRYANLAGYSRNYGASAEGRLQYDRLTASAGVTYADLATVDADGRRERVLLSERFSGVWGLSVTLPQNLSRRHTWSVDYNGSVYGPMLLPVQGPRDPRPGASPWFSLQNVQLTFKPAGGRLEVYGGLKNLLDFTPRADAIARGHDPFDRRVKFDAAGDPVPTAENPNALVFDPSYVFASNVGRRAFLGARWRVR